MDVRRTERRWPTLVVAADAGRRVTSTVDELRRASRGRLTVESNADDRPGHLPCALVEQAGADPGASVIVVEALGGGPATGPLFDDVAETVLAISPHPVLVLGPEAPASGPPTALVAVVDATSALGPLALVVADLAAAIGDLRVVVAELAAPDPWAGDDDPAVDPVRALARTLGADERHRIIDADPHAALRRAADLVPGAIVTVAARRWTDPGERWYGRARQLIRTARAPVLVVPDDLAEASHRSPA